jgi:Uma2 family endonuclease
MATGTLMSVEEYLKYSGKPNCEYIDGVLRPKAMGTTAHAMIQYLLLVLLNRQGVEALPEVTVRLTPTKFLVPDVVADSVIDEPYPTKPVLLCVEVLCPGDRLGEALAKCEDYHAWGVPYCWVVDPVKQNAWEYHAQGEPVKIETAGSLHAGNLVVNLPELFAKR